MQTQSKKSGTLQLIPIFFCFAVMGFIDIVGVSVSHVKQDFGLNDKVANLLPSMTLIWFLLISIPTATLMRRIGRKSTVLTSLVIMAVAMVLPLVHYGFAAVFAGFALLGIGNTILQVSLNPLLKSMVAEERTASALSFGQFTKSVISLLGPVLIGWAAGSFGNWTMVFCLYAAATAIAAVWLWLTPVRPAGQEDAGQGESLSAPSGGVFSLLRDGYVLICFSVIVMIVGFEICLTSVVPQHFLEAFGTPIEKGGLGCSVYYAAKTAGTFLGGVILARVSPSGFLKWSSLLLVAAFGGYWACGSQAALYVLIAVIGLAGANAFAIAYSLAMQRRPEKSDEVSALMITGVAGGAVLPPIMGAVSDAAGMYAGFVVPMLAAVAVTAAAFALDAKKKN